MMFICQKCLKPEHKWKAGYGTSRGPCEICGVVSQCADVPADNAFVPEVPDVEKSQINLPGL